MKLKKFTFAVIAAAQVFVFSGAVHAGEPNLVKTEKNGELINIINDDKTPLESKDNELEFLEDSTLLKKYNNVIGEMKYVPQIKDQGSRGTCWANSSISAIESAYMRENDITEPSEAERFSVEHIVESSAGNGDHGFVIDENEGGNTVVSESYFTWASHDSATNLYGGPVKEDESLPYFTDEKPKYSENLDLYERVAYPFSFSANDYSTELTEGQLAARNEKIKKWLTEKGSVSISVYCGEALDDNDKGFLWAKNEETGTIDKVFYQTNVSAGSNHAVTIVGYDDNYPKENFDGFENVSSVASTPKNNGAFIVANSWGEDWGNNGYFYMSYETNIPRISLFCDVKNIDKTGFDLIYDYTPVGYNASDGLSKHDETSGEDTPLKKTINVKNAGESTASDKEVYYMWAENIFDKKTNNENLTHIGVFTRYADTYVVLTYDNDVKNTESERISTAQQFVTVGSDNASSRSGEVEAVTIDGNSGFLIKTPGYYVFELNEPIEITGSAFGVGASYYSEYNANPMPICFESTNNGYKYKKLGNTLYINGDTSDIGEYDYTVSVKAYTDTQANKIYVDDKAYYIENEATLNETFSGIDDVNFYENYTMFGSYFPKYDYINWFSHFDKDTKFDESFAGIDLYTDTYIGNLYDIDKVPEPIIAAVQEKEDDSDKVRVISKINTSDIPENANFYDIKYIFIDGEGKITYTEDTDKKMYTNGVSDLTAEDGDIMFASEEMSKNVINYDPVNAAHAMTAYIMQTKDEDIFAILSGSEYVTDKIQ
ncbi:MAG: C1 family peptidase [Firmicutes bacterium]|nr:C1 family peptidase [Bacillota bacterium]